jgi:hypothetical protein
MKKFCLLMFCLIGFVGCEKNKYTVTLRPQGDTIKREITCQRMDENNLRKFPQEELNRLAKIYGVKAPESAEKVFTFTGTFHQDLPKDFDGAGWYLRYPSSMGDSYIYSERFRGSDDLEAGIDARKRAVNQLVDLTIGYFQSQMQWEWRFGRLKKFLDTDFRYDMQNLCLYFWTAELSDKTDEIIFRMVQYLAERGYFTPADGPEIVMSLNSEQNPEIIISAVRNLVARKMGYDPKKNMPKSLAFLSDSESIQKSVEKYLADTKEYKALLKKWEDLKKIEENLNKPEPIEVLSDLFSRAAGGNGVYPDVPDLNSLGSELELTLVTFTKPYLTNGTVKVGKVEWKSALTTSAGVLPPYAYACWAVPNEKFQMVHFGKVILEGNDLSEYCLWLKSLSETRLKEWNAFLESLSPGPTLTKKLAAFRFSDELKGKTDTATAPSSEANQWATRFYKLLFEKPVKTNTPTSQPKP